MDKVRDHRGCFPLEIDFCVTRDLYLIRGIRVESDESHRKPRVWLQGS